MSRLDTSPLADFVAQKNTAMREYLQKKGLWDDAPADANPWLVLFSTYLLADGKKSNVIQAVKC